jgi:hypothetical protein
VDLHKFSHFYAISRFRLAASTKPTNSKTILIYAFGASQLRNTKRKKDGERRNNKEE